MKNILSICLLMLASCGPVTKWDSLPIGVNANDEADLQVLEYYNETFGREIFVDDENGIAIDRVETIDCEDLGNAGCLGLTTFGGGDVKNARVDVLDDMQSHLYFCVLAHELGHVLTGTDHLESGLMAPSVACPAKREDTIDDLFFEYVSEIYNF